MSDITFTPINVSYSVPTQKNKMRGLMLGVAISGIIAGCGLGYATDFVVDTPTILQNGSVANVLDGDDSLTITESGEINISGDNAVETTGAGNTVKNFGLITTTGIGDDGILVLNGNTVQNNGKIITLGDGIQGQDSNTIINNGLIMVEGASRVGILHSNFGTIINNGSILSEHTGIRANFDHLIENHGSIIVEDSGIDGRAIDSAGENTIINTGYLKVTGVDGETIDVTIDNLIINSGSILAFGSGTVGFTGLSQNVINNSGRVISSESWSFDFNDGGGVQVGENVLNLFAPSFIGGEVELGSAYATDTAVNITTGASHSILWDFSTGELLGGDPTIDGTVPWFYDSTTKKIATFDPSILTASVETLTDRTAMISATIQRRLEAAELVINGVQRGKPYGDAAEMDPGTFDKSGAWLQVMGSHSEQNGSAETLDRDITLGGVAIGYDANMGKDTRFGVMAGYIDGHSKAASRWSKSFESNSSGFFAAGYGRKSFGQIFVDLGLSAGIGTDNETTRFVNDNLAALGESYAMGDPGNSFWISPEMTIGTQIKTTSNWTFAPSAKLRYAAEWLSNYTESGPSADANATVDDRMIAVGEARLELAASRHVMIGNSVRALITARGGALGRASFGEDASITLLGVTQDVSDFYEDSFAIFAGLDASFAVGDRLNLDLSTSTTHGNDMTNVQGAAALGVLF